VLVVEDNVILRYALCVWLRDEAHEVLEAATADEALSVLRSIVTVDIVVTDVEMPGSMSGLDLTTYLRGNSPSLPVIVVSGNPLPKDYPHASAFFRKPYVLDAISAQIKALVVDQDTPAAEKKADRQ
jgi:CheY-like chemotaxis protein